MREAQRLLVELGLSEKEGSIYLALLEIGRANVHQIAKKSVVNRTTAYEILEMLATKGIVSRSEENGKAAYIAESPSRFEQTLRKEEQSLKQKQKHLEEAMPQLFALYNAIEDKPGVRFYEGEEGIAAAREAMSNPEGEYLSFFTYDEALLRIGKIAQSQRIRNAERSRGRMIIAVSPGLSVEPLNLRNWEFRKMAEEIAPFTGEINIIKGRVGAFFYKTKPVAIIIEGQEIVNLFRSMFEMAWLGAKPINISTYYKKNVS